MEDMLMAVALCDAVNAIRRVDALHDKMDSCLTAGLGKPVTSVELQMLFSEFEDSRVKVVWCNSFLAKYDIEFVEFLKKGLMLFMS